jgi:hypothetical protein
MKKPKALPPEIVSLRGLPIDQRVDALVSMFRFCTSEFAVLVLEHVKQPKPKRKRRRR